MAQVLNEQTTGIWGDDPKADAKINQFLTSRDIYSDPAALSMNRADSESVAKLMSMRTDSRGEPIKRGLLGDKQNFHNFVDKLEQRKKGF